MGSKHTQQEALLSGQNRMTFPTYPPTVNLKPFVLGSLDILGSAEHHGCQSDVGAGPIMVQGLEQPYDTLMQHCQLSVRLQGFLFIHCHLVGDVKAPWFSPAQAYLSGSIFSVTFEMDMSRI